jgi:hypothetical protein
VVCHCWRWFPKPPSGLVSGTSGQPLQTTANNRQPPQTLPRPLNRRACRVGHRRDPRTNQRKPSRWRLFAIVGRCLRWFPGFSGLCRSPVSDNNCKQSPTIANSPPAPHRRDPGTRLSSAGRAGCPQPAAVGTHDLRASNSLLNRGIPAPSPPDQLETARPSAPLRQQPPTTASSPLRSPATMANHSKQPPTTANSPPLPFAVPLDFRPSPTTLPPLSSMAR